MRDLFAEDGDSPTEQILTINKEYAARLEVRQESFMFLLLLLSCYGISMLV
jgi:hypothetical protein